MIQMRTKLKVADNSGARKIMAITPLGGGVGQVATIGDVISASVREADPDSKIQKGKVVRAVIVRTRKKSEGKTVLIFALMTMRQLLSIRQASHLVPVSLARWAESSEKRSL